MNVNNQRTYKNTDIDTYTHTHTQDTLPVVYQYLVSADVISSIQKQHEARFILLLDRHQKCGTFGLTVHKQNDGNYIKTESSKAQWSLYVSPV